MNLINYANSATLLMHVLDLSADSPVLWLRLDPDMTLLRSTFIEQSDYQWQFQLRYERDVTAQMEAISALECYPTPATRLALTNTIKNEQSYYKVRCRAAHCLTKVRICCQLAEAIIGHVLLYHTLLISLVFSGILSVHL
jgi:HEAT repeat protein